MLESEAGACYTVIMKNTVKTNAMRLLDRAKLPYQIHSYPHHEKDPIDGIHVAQMLHQNAERVFKTLIMRSHSKEIYVFVLPVNSECDLKKCAKAVQEKSMEMVHVKEIQAISGYIRGGCSPIGMKKQYPTVFDKTCMNWETICFSGGKIGCQIEMAPQDVIALIHAQIEDIRKEETSSHLIMDHR